MGILISVITSFYILPLGFTVFIFTMMKIQDINNKEKIYSGNMFTYKKILLICLIPVVNLIIMVIAAIQAFKQLPKAIKEVTNKEIK